ncbi:hypothetical protein L798_13859 [Zootermopsis nevadensis]|uniref:Uncharacterized protein n=1 Tax=Zootermopsis nevadensis TaxID=136037 RepID=A0A067QT93_ZOONE|nr:hypothetical protein L798_13859 [Zootermopsis nevadensis]
MTDAVGRCLLPEQEAVDVSYHLSWCGSPMQVKIAPYFMSRGGESVASFIEVVKRRFVRNCCGKMWRLSLGFLLRMLFYNWPRREQTFLRKTERTFLSHHATCVNGQIVKCTCYAMN